MLKWTVAGKRETDRSDMARRSSVGACTVGGDLEKPASRRKRRRSSASRRSTERRSRSSLCLDANKENRFTSTPIKGGEEPFQPDAFRDVSNLTPKKKSDPAEPKRKKQCVDPAHGQQELLQDVNFFRPFEAVDSHIEGLTVSWAPTYAGNCTPKRHRQLLKFADICPPNKRAKIDHVSDFLQQISLITSPEDDRTRVNCREDLMVSPLVKRLVDLKFGKAKAKGSLDDSSYINELSLDKIVDAILDNTKDTICQQRDNELNETHEDNLINTESERRDCDNASVSTDSGFRSASTEPSHNVDVNFTCKCNNNNLTGNAVSDFSKTIINLNETFNERCVDVSPSERRETAGCFTLKRQKCIRKRRQDDSSAKKNVSDGNDHSFDSCESNHQQETFLAEAPKGRRCLSFGEDRRGVGGVIDLEVRYADEGLTINVFRCEDLRRAAGHPVNAYVKVVLSEKSQLGRRRRKQGALQRTAVQAESHDPVFDHSFRVPVGRADLQRVLHVEVWHRDRVLRRSEFLGCVSFVIKNAIKKNIAGTYPLLPQHRGRCGRGDPTVIAGGSAEGPSEMCDSQSSAEEALTGGFGSDIDADLKKTTNKTALSQQQKDADENLFLRYLELDPTEGPEAAPAAAQRKATGNKSSGRTPFTATMTLRRPPRGGFGFSVVWTHPPRIERVEKGLPADRSGILPGDYIIFVDKHNVVMMPEVDILNLIRSFGSQLTLEIFRRSASSRNGSVPSVRRLTASFDGGSTVGLGLPPAPPSTITQRRPSTVCSTNTASVEYNRKKLHLPQVTFSTEKPTNSADEARRKAMYQILTKEQQYATAMQFSMARFVSALAERKDLIGPAEHRVLFQNADELLRITEDILDCLVRDDGDYQTNLLLRTYHIKLVEITGAYKRYCCGIKKADYVLANITKNQEFVRFLQTPAIPRRRPDITVFIHKPLEHYREVLKLFNVILSNTRPNQEEYPVINQIVHELQVSYREITSEAGLMEPVGEGRPLLSVQDLENRLVFTKCKPFVLAKPGRQWIFGGDLSRVEGRTVRQYWALLFNDILLFAKVSRDRVLFILEDPLPLAHITDFFFNVRKKANEFRIIVEPGGHSASSPTVHCGPDLSRTPRKNPTKRCVVLRTPTVELKAVWQNLLQRQIFHVNAGMDGSSYSSPLESPEAPITSSVVTLQSAESLSLRRQTPRNINYLENDQKKQIDELIEHKCKQLEKSSSSSKSNAIHLEQWMKGQFSEGSYEEALEDEHDDFELWTEDMVRKRSEELNLIDPSGNPCSEARRAESRCEDIAFSEQDQSPSRSTNTTESQVTVRSSPLVPETVNVCRQCHRTCVTTTTTNQNGNVVGVAHRHPNNVNCRNNNDDDDWRPLMLMGLAAINPTTTLVKLDPFAAPLPRISVLPPTPELQATITQAEYIPTGDINCNCRHEKPQIGELVLNKDYDNSPDDSPMNDEQPYHSLNSSNLTLRRFGTVSSLERVGSEDREETFDTREDSSGSEGDVPEEELEEEEEVEEEEEEEEVGIDNEAFNNSSIMSWTARAGSFVAEKMAFFEKLGEDYRTGGKFFERYLKSEIAVNGDDVQEEETSGATSGEEIWGTPTSGGELDDPLSSPNYDGHNSPSCGGSLSSNEDTELMMDELLMTPPVTGANIRGLLPRRTLEPLMEEEYSDSYTSSSSTPTEPSASPEQGNGTGDAADKCSAAAERTAKKRSSEELGTRAAECQPDSVAPTIHRSESYRRIIEQEDDNVGFFTRFRSRPSMKFINIERIPQARGVKFLEFFNVRRERKIYETFPGGKHLIKVFSREGDFSDDVPTSYSEKPESILRVKERQLDRRFWKQLSKRRGNKPVQLSA